MSWMIFWVEKYTGVYLFGNEFLMMLNKITFLLKLKTLGWNKTYKLLSDIELSIVRKYK